MNHDNLLPAHICCGTNWTCLRVRRDSGMHDTIPGIGLDEFDPISIVERVARERAWEFDRMSDDQINVLHEGMWRNYGLTLVWLNFDETLRIACTFDIEPPESRVPELQKLVTLVNDRFWSGSFSLWQEESVMVFRYGLLLNGEIGPTQGQVEAMVTRSIDACERFYPAFQVVCLSDRSPREALSIAISETYGRA